MRAAVTHKLKRGHPEELDLSLAHSPDCDDAFMFYALATKKIRSGNLRFLHALEDIETLNQKALRGVYDVTAISYHAYAHLADRYLLLPSGSSFGDRYGPVVVARSPVGPRGLRGKRVASPGKMTTAFLLLQLFEPDHEPVVTPFDQILEVVAKGEADAGVVIHEGQLTYADRGLSKVVDLGEWWHRETGLPIPLGGNAVRRSLEPEVIRKVAAVLKESIQYALDHREEALAYALGFSRGLNTPTVDQFVSMYVNHWTLNLGERGRQAVQILLDRGHQKGLLPHAVQAEFAE